MSERLDGMVIPKHVALILDGNGRWAKKRGLPRTFGHKEGCVTVEKTVEIAARMGIKYLTVYGFSTENWKRSEEEVGALMQLFRYYMVRLLKIASANNVRVKMIGDRRRFAQDIIDGINRLEEETKDNTGLTFVIAVNYGGRDEIRRAAAKLAEDVKSQYGETLHAVGGIGISAMMHGYMVFDKAGENLYLLLIWIPRISRIRIC